MSAEKRRYPRLSAEVLVLSVRGVKPVTLQHIEPKDISETGISFYTDSAITQGMTLELEINHATDQLPITTMAEAMWVRILFDHERNENRYVAGVKFLDEHHRGTLKRLIDKHHQATEELVWDE